MNINEMSRNYWSGSCRTCRTCSAGPGLAPFLKNLVVFPWRYRTVRAIQRAQKGSFKLFHHCQRRTKKPHAFAARQASVSKGQSCRDATKRRTSSLHDKPQLTWVEAVAFVNGLRLAACHSSYNGIILFLRLLEASSSANFAHKRVITDFYLWGCTHKKLLKS